MSKLKVGIIGVGNIVRFHMPGWAKSEHAEVVAAADVNEKVLKNWGEKNNINKLYTNPFDLINDIDIDIIDICAPNNYHSDLVIQSLKSGKHVLCEKPLAPTYQEIEEMIDVRDKYNKKLMCAQHFRFRQDSQIIKKEVQSIGEIYHARSWMIRRNYLPVKNSFLQKENSGGGACIDIGVHVLDLTLWFMGNPNPISVSGVSKTELAKQNHAFSKWGEYDKNIIDVEEFAAAFVKFDNDSSLILEVSWMLHHQQKPDIVEDMQVWLYGKEGGLHWPKLNKTSIDKSNMQDKDEILSSKYIDNEKPHAEECIEFAKSIYYDKPSPVAAEESFNVMRILNAIYKSQKTKKEIIL